MLSHFRSIRWTLQIWHGTILVLALTGLGSASVYQVSQSRWGEIDARLEGAARLLLARLTAPHRPPPRPRDDHDWSPPGPFGEGPDDHRPEEGPPPRHREMGGPGGPPDDGPRPEEGRPEDRGDPQHHPAPRIDLPPTFLAQYAGPGDEAAYYIVRRADGTTITISANAPNPESVDLQALPAAAAVGVPRVFVSGGHRIVKVSAPDEVTILVGRPVTLEQKQLRTLAMSVAATGAAVLVIGLIGGWALSRRALKPIDAMSATGEALSATNLSGRIDDHAVPAELGKLARVLNAAFARLEAAFQRQARFTADASHELRTPLAVIHSNVELALSRDRSPEEYRQTLSTCLKASSRMRRLIDSLLLLARADAGGLDLEVRPFDLRETIEECAGLLTPLAVEHNVRLELVLRPAVVNADATRIAQVVANLLTNAIRHNRKDGSVRVLTAVEETHILLTVIDTGIGISSDDQPHLFERFFSANKARSRKAGGSGLGLAICRSIVEAHGGTISLTSKLDQGTTVQVRLPGAATDATAEAHDVEQQMLK